jgi:tetratricopeptide (TPR) repeat protein
MNRKYLAAGGAVVLLLLLLGGLFVWAPWKSGKGEEISVTSRETDIRANTLRLASEYFQQGEYQRALDLVDQLLLQNPDDDEARTLRDSVLQARREAETRKKQEDLASQQDLSESLSNLSASLREDKSRPAAQPVPQMQPRDDEAEKAAARSEAERKKREEINRLIQEGVAAMERSSYGEARDKFDQALGIDPDVAYAYAMKGESFFREDSENQSSLNQAVSNANRAIQKDSSLWIPHNTLGNIYVKTRRWDDAIRHFKEAARLNPENADILFELGKVQYRTGRFRDAKDSFEGAIHLVPNFDRAYFNLGLTETQLGNTDRAVSAFSNTIHYDPELTPAYFALANAYRSKGDLGKAAENYKTAVTRDPENVNYNLYYGINLYDQEKYEQAEAYFNNAVDLDESRADVYYNLAQARIKLNKANAALEAAAQAVKLKGDSPLYVYTLGQSAELTGNIDYAVQAYEKAIALDPSYIKPRINLGILYDRRGEYDRALKHLLAAYKVDSSSIEVNNNLGNVYLHAELYRDAITHYKKAVAAQPNATLMRYNLAIAYIETDQKALAKESLSELIKIDPAFWDAYYRLGMLLYSEGETEGAQAIFKRLLERQPNYSRRAEIEKLL